MNPRKAASFFWILLIFCRAVLPERALFAETSNPLASPPKDAAFIENLLHKIETRQGGWIAMKARLRLSMTAAENEKGACEGELLYQRLDEKILLTCSDPKGKTLFVLKTSDRLFELYLAAAKRIYCGTIFQLEDSPEIESHLKVLDLYRALKPLTFLALKARVQERGKDLVALVIQSSEEGKAGTRKIFATDRGDVLREIYEAPNAERATFIERFDFTPLPAAAGDAKIIFPRRIEVREVSKDLTKDFRETRIVFASVHFLPSIERAAWENPAPKDITRQDLREDGNPSNSKCLEDESG